MENNAIKIFVIVVTYNGMRWYDRCFTSLRNSSIPLQTIVVDNASNDGSVEYIKEKYPEIHLIESKVNLGFGKGNNLAIQYALEQKCDYVFLLNQDAWLDRNDTLKTLVSIAQRHPEYGILSPIHLTVDKKEIEMSVEYGGGRYSLIMLSDMYCGMLKDVYETNYASAVSWLLSRETIMEVGGFNPIFRQYGEDDEYMNRCRYYGKKIGICFGVDIIHDHQKTLNPFCYNQSQYYHEQALLVKMLDMNTKITPFRYWLFCFRKMFVSFFRGNWNESKQWRYDCHTIHRYGRRVIRYRANMLRKCRIGL